MSPSLEVIRADFPILKKKMSAHPLVYLDNGATTQKPATVIDRMRHFMADDYATIHRGIYELSQKATAACDLSRQACQAFLNAQYPHEIVFTRGTTEAINLVARAYAGKFMKPGDEIVISAMEHHSNIVPWQAIAEEKGLMIKVIPVDDDGDLYMEKFVSMMNARTKLVAVCHVSNALGTVNPVEEIVRIAKAGGACVLLDGAQAVSHMPVDVQKIGCDFYAFSGHKVYGPTGIGVLYGKSHILEAMDPYQFGGDMIESVSYERTTYAKLPAKFEAGTPAITEILGLQEALNYVKTLGFEWIGAHENELLSLATQKLSEVPGLTIIGRAKKKASLVSFVLDGIHPHDVGTILNEEGIAVRTGHHCAQPLMRRYGLAATTRASFALYNTPAEIDKLVSGIGKVREVFGHGG